MKRADTSDTEADKKKKLNGRIENMGYDSVFECLTKFKPKDYKAIIKAIKKTEKANNIEWECFVPQKNGEFDIKENPAHWYFSEYFALALAPFLTGDWHFYGEDDDDWGYRFKDGKVWVMERVWHDTEKELLKIKK